MYLKEFRIRKIKCFKDLSLTFQKRGENGDPQDNWNVILGDNGDGKTTLLRCIAACLVDQPTATKVLDRKNLVRKKELSASLLLSMQGEEGDRIQNGESGELAAYYSILQGGGQIGLNEEEKSISSSSRIYEADPEHGEFADEPDTKLLARYKKDMEFLTKHAYQHREQNGWVSCGYGPLRRPTGHSRLLENINEDLEKRFLTLFHEGAALLECENWIKELERRALKAGGHSEEHRAFEEVKGVLCSELLPGVEEVILERDLLFKWRGEKMTLDQMSDGYRIMFVLLADLLRWLEALRPPGAAICETSGVVFIDEVDSHLHPKWQRELGFDMVRVFPNIQFIVTTHSPFIVMAAGENSLTVLRKEDGEANVVVAERETFLRGEKASLILENRFGLTSLRDSLTEKEMRRYEELLSKPFATKIPLSDKEQLEKDDLAKDLNRRLQDDPAAPRTARLEANLEFLSAQLRTQFEEGNDKGTS